MKGLRSGRGEGIDEPRDGRVGSHRPETRRLGPQHPHIGQAVPAERDRQGHIQQHLPRIVHRPRLAPRCQSSKYRLVQPSLTGRLHQQDPSRLRHHRPTTTLDTDTRVGPDTLLHLGSASDGDRNKNLDNPHSCRSEALLVYLTTRRTPGFMKARG